MTWTTFLDMSGGGHRKLVHKYIAVQLPEPIARKWFEHTFDIDPDNVTRSCCGSDYSVDECESPVVGDYWNPRLIVPDPVSAEAREAAAGDGPLDHLPRWEMELVQAARILRPVGENRGSCPQPAAVAEKA